MCAAQILAEKVARGELALTEVDVGNRGWRSQRDLEARPRRLPVEQHLCAKHCSANKARADQCEPTAQQRQPKIRCRRAAAALAAWSPQVGAADRQPERNEGSASSR